MGYRQEINESKIMREQIQLQQSGVNLAEDKLNQMKTVLIDGILNVEGLFDNADKDSSAYSTQDFNELIEKLKEMIEKLDMNQNSSHWMFELWKEKGKK